MEGTEVYPWLSASRNQGLEPYSCSELNSVNTVNELGRGSQMKVSRGDHSSANKPTLGFT